MDNLQHFRTATHEYPHLQGLRQVPLALFIAGIALKRAGIVGSVEINLITFGVPLLFAMILLWYGIGKYYERRFGFVEPRAEKGRKALTALFLVLVFAGFLAIEFNGYGGQFFLPVSLSGIFLGFLYFSTGRSTRRLYYVVFGALLILEGLLPLPLGKTVLDPVYGTLGILYGLTFGLGLLVISLIDHIRLVRAFRASAGNK